MASARSPLGFLRAGGGVAKVRRDNRNIVNFDAFPVPVTFEEETTQDVAYAFVDLRRPLGRTLDLELRLGFDSVDQSETRVPPRRRAPACCGIPSPSFLARVAAGRVLKRPIVVNQTIAPAELAGFDVVLDDRDATISDQVGLAAEYRPFPSLRLGTEIERRWLSHQETRGLETVTDDQKELLRAGLRLLAPVPTPCRDARGRGRPLPPPLA